MDKVIIDGVDVNKCGYYKDGDCLLCPVTCEEFIDCEFKEIKRLQAENEQLKKSIDRIMQNKEIKTIDLDIAKENVELKAENDRLKEEKEHYRKEAYRLADGLNKTENLAFTYKQALQEIRDMADENKDTAQYRGICLSILAKINEVIGAE